MLTEMAEFPFLRQNSIQLCVYAIFIHSSVDGNQLVSIAYLLSTVLQCTWESRCISETLIPKLSGVHPEVGFLDHVVVLLLMSWGITILFSIMVAPFYFPTNNEEMFMFECFLSGV